MSKETEKDIEQDIREMEAEVENIEIEAEEVIAEEATKNIDEPKIEKSKEDEYEQKYLRLLADFENLKRNTAKDVLNAKNNGKIEVFREVVDVLDNFERSMQFDPTTEDYQKGIELVHKQLVDKLEKTGLEKVATDGIMDANVHQAVMVDTVDDLEEEEIIEILQHGYKLEDRLIRPAMVKVNKK